MPFFERKLSNLLIVSGSPLQSYLPALGCHIHSASTGGLCFRKSNYRRSGKSGFADIYTSNQVADALAKLAPPIPAIFTSPLPLGIHNVYLTDLQNSAAFRFRAAPSSTSQANDHLQPPPSSSHSSIPTLHNLFPEHLEPHLRLSQLVRNPHLNGQYSYPTSLNL